LHGVDTQVRLADLSRQPLAEGVQTQPLTGLTAVFQARGRDGFKRVVSTVARRLFADMAAIVGVQVLVGLQGIQQAFEVEGLFVGEEHNGVRAFGGS